MDWFQWLSQTTLHPSLVYSYGVLFACNDLTLNDVAYFDHDFLLSMGVKVGKHRLEILKLARAETHKRVSLKRLLSSAGKGLVRCAKKMVSGGRKKEPEELSFGRRLSPLRVEWKEIREEEEVKRIDRSEVGFDGSRFLRSPVFMSDSGKKTATKSGPLGMRKVMAPVLGHRKYLSGPINGGRPMKSHSPRFSGPLDQKPALTKSPIYSGPLDERLALTKSPRNSGPLDERPGFIKSPRLSGQLDGCYVPECHSPWATLFEDLKPN